MSRCCHESLEVARQLTSHFVGLEEDENIVGFTRVNAAGLVA